MENVYFENIEEMDLEVLDFEPMVRSRSNTWPVPQPENYVDNNFLVDTISKIGSTDHVTAEHLADAGTSEQPIESSRTRKPPRKNPWGDQSYADLIAQAINSSQNRKLTLSQIYDWMVQNISFFRDKSESKSSAGWKNSIRHNLSLHNRFIRVPNENQGKSSWWIINPDEKSKKTTRRRAASMEAGKLAKKRTLAKKQADSLRKKLAKNEMSTALNSNVDNGAQSPIANNNFQPSFRPRASSCVSAYGRLSAIPQEPDWAMTESSYEQPIQLSIPEVVNNQECLPTNDQVFYASQNLTVTSDYCLLHPLKAYNCNESVPENEVTINSNQQNAAIVKDIYVHYTLQENSVDSVTSHATIPQSALLSHKEESEVNCNNYALIDQILNEATEISVLPRNNSMLDDINEIISKDQRTEIEKVNDTISTTLFITQNNVL